jgi:cytochrome b561
MPAWLAGVAHINQWALYLALIAQPVIGFLTTNAHGFPLDWFGLFTVWSPIGKSPAIADTLSAVHYWLGLAILLLIVLHIAGVLYHRVIRRDDTLSRMT